MLLLFKNFYFRGFFRHFRFLSRPTATILSSIESENDVKKKLRNFLFVFDENLKSEIFLVTKSRIFVIKFKFLTKMLNLNFKEPLHLKIN